MKDYFKNSPILCNVYCKEMGNWPNIGATLNDK